MITDEQFARAVHGSGLVTRDQLKDFAAQRLAGESLSRTMLRLGALPPGEILRFDPNALDGATGAEQRQREWRRADQWRRRGG